MSNYFRNLLWLHAIVFIWGFTGILGKLISLDSLPLVWWRMGFAVAALLLYLLVKRTSLALSGRQLVVYLGTGAIIAVHWLTFFAAIKASTVSITLACLSSGALFTALLEPVLLKKKFQIYEVFLSAMVIVGLGIIFFSENDYWLGMQLALLSAFLSALFTIINSQLIKTDRALRISFFELLGGWLVIGLALLAGAQFTPEFFNLSVTDLGWLLLLGVVCTAFAYVVSVQIMKVLMPFTVSLTINLEPVYTILLALAIFGEEEFMSPTFYFGVVLILTALFVNAWLKRKARLKVEAGVLPEGPVAPGSHPG